MNLIRVFLIVLLANTIIFDGLALQDSRVRSTLEKKYKKQTGGRFQAQLKYVTNMHYSYAYFLADHENALFLNGAKVPSRKLSENKEKLRFLLHNRDGVIARDSGTSTKCTVGTYEYIVSVRAKSMHTEKGCMDSSRFMSIVDSIRSFE